MRRFLENFGDSVDLVVLCVDNASDLQQYQKLMPLYMPRDKDEETAAKLLLPNDTGTSRKHQHAHYVSGVWSQ